MRLDPRAPLVLSTHELGRQPGSARSLELSVPAPTNLGIELIGVPEGSSVELQLRLEAVAEGVLLSGRARAVLAGECARCLGAVASELEAPIQELYVYPDRAIDDADDARLEGDLLDLEPALRDAVVLALPYRPVCRPDCPGLCPVCGARLADQPRHAHDGDTDPRWSALAALGSRDVGTRTGEDEE